MTYLELETIYRNDDIIIYYRIFIYFFPCIKSKTKRNVIILYFVISYMNILTKLIFNLSNVIWTCLLFVTLDMDIDLNKPILYYLNAV